MLPLRMILPVPGYIGGDAPWDVRHGGAQSRPNGPMNRQMSRPTYSSIRLFGRDESTFYGEDS